MQNVYQIDETEKRKLRFLYHQSGIEQRYSAVPDFDQLKVSPELFVREGEYVSDPLLESRMKIFDKVALELTLEATEKCIKGVIEKDKITHLITVSCTGMSAPGLDLQLMELMNLNKNLFRTSVNFMGCYAAIHALKMADMICRSTATANVLIVAVELCTLHFQKEFNADNAASSLLFADGCAAVLVSNQNYNIPKVRLDNFYAEVSVKGKSDMAWQLASNGFQMRLSGYIPQLIEEDITALVQAATNEAGLNFEDIEHWCVHPGGKRILDTIEKKLSLKKDALEDSRRILKTYGNMSSPTVLFVLESLMRNKHQSGEKIMGLAFGPGLTMETFIGNFV